MVDYPSVSLMGQGPATKIQNEIGAAGASDQGDRSEVGNTEGTGDGGASGFVPVSLVGQGLATEIQNEIGAAGGSDQGERSEVGNAEGTWER